MTDLLDMRPEQIVLARNILRGWQDHELGKFPVSAQDLANSLAAFDASGIAPEKVLEGFQASFTATVSQNGAEGRYKYACKTIWQRHKASRSLEDVIDQLEEDARQWHQSINHSYESPGDLIDFIDAVRWDGMEEASGI